MGEVLLLGMTHFPRLRLPDEQWNALFLKMLQDPAVPEHMRDPAAWPEGLRAEWSDDQGLAAARAQRKALTKDFRIMRAELDRFDPDFIVIWGDDQYENFREDGIPPYSILAYDHIDVEAHKLRPIKNADATRAITLDQSGAGESDETIRIDCHREGAKHFASGLINRGFDVTYAYKPRHLGLGHAFLNTILYLGADERGFPWKIVPFAVNCYGRIVISQKGFPRSLSETPTDDLDPPSPPAWRCFDMGAKCARIAKESPYRIAFIASSSWSHAFMTRKNYLLFPDMEADKKLYADLVAGEFASWRERTLEQIEDSGQQEVLNWVCLAGAFHELGTKPDFAHFHETYLFNSPKVFVSGAG